MADNTIWNSLFTNSLSLSLKQIELISILSYDYFSQLHRRGPPGLDVTSGGKNLEVAADWDPWRWSSLSLRKSSKSTFFSSFTPLSLSQNRQNSENLSGMEWPHVGEGRTIDKMVLSLTWRSVIPSSVSSEALSESKGLSCSPLLMGIFWCFCKSKQVGSTSVIPVGL